MLDSRANRPTVRRPSTSPAACPAKSDNIGKNNEHASASGDNNKNKTRRRRGPRQGGGVGRGQRRVSLRETRPPDYYRSHPVHNHRGATRAASSGIPRPSRRVPSAWHFSCSTDDVGLGLWGSVMMPQTGKTSSLVVLCERLSLPLLHDSVHACVRAQLARSPHVRSIVCERRTQTHKHKHQHKHDSNTNTNKLELNN